MSVIRYPLVPLKIFPSISRAAFLTIGGWFSCCGACDWGDDKTDDVVGASAFQAALGEVWSHVDPASLTPERFLRTAITGQSMAHFIVRINCDLQ